MEDAAIVEQYFRREESALQVTQEKYSAYCRAIAWGVLRDEGSSEECVNDALLKAWNSIPPNRPRSLRAYLGALCRNAALSRYREAHAERRGGSQIPLALEELQESIPGSGGNLAERAALGAVLSDFLRALPERERYLFLRRYWYLDSIPELAEQLSMQPGAVRTQLHRTRRKLKAHLEKEGIGVEA